MLDLYFIDAEHELHCFREDVENIDLIFVLNQTHRFDYCTLN